MLISPEKKKSMKAAVQISKCSSITLTVQEYVPSIGVHVAMTPQPNLFLLKARNMQEVWQSDSKQQKTKMIYHTWMSFFWEQRIDLWTLQSCQFNLITARPVKANDLRLMSSARVETPELAVTSDWSRFHSHPVQVLFRDRPFAFGQQATSGSGYVTEPLCIRTALASVACKPSHRHTPM